MDKISLIYQIKTKVIVITAEDILIDCQKSHLRKHTQSGSVALSEIIDTFMQSADIEKWWATCWL